MVVELFSTAVTGAFHDCTVRIEAFAAVDVTAVQWIPLDSEHYLDGIRAIVGESADVRSLSDNYLIMRYQAKANTHASWQDDGHGANGAWSQWTTPALAEGWIKRVLKGINPFNQRVTDLFNNQVNTDVSLITQAGARWEGDVALNLNTINKAGLIGIYETVIHWGNLLSLSAGLTYGPAYHRFPLASSDLHRL